MPQCEKERETEMKRDAREGEGGTPRARGRLNDDSEVDGFLGPFYIESQRSA